jgi:hypothetical protein
MTMRKATSRILQGAREALAYAAGEADGSAFRFRVHSDVDVKALRRRKEEVDARDKRGHDDGETETIEE